MTGFPHTPRIRIGLALCAAALLAWLGTPASGITVELGPGDDLQAALNSARPGDVLLLRAGATFVGNFQLPAKEGARYITIRSSAAAGQLPGDTERITPRYAPVLPTIRSPNQRPALRTAPGARYWRIVAVAFEGAGTAGDVIALGDGSRAQNSLEAVPEHLILDRVLIRGDAARGQKRGIALNSGATTIRNSHIADIKSASQETQAIAGWNGPGPYLIENNYLEASGVIVLFGGADPSIDRLVPSDIVVRRNHVTRPVGWRRESWAVKNLFELKNARRVRVEGNVFEHNWPSAQAGYAIVFTVRNSGGRAPWAAIEHVVFQNNIVRHVAAGINILGFDDTDRSGQARGILIRNNLFDDVDHRNWGGNGAFLQMGEEAADVHVDHNTILHSGNVVTAYGGSRTAPRPLRGFRLTNNVARHNAYGIFGNSVGVGNSAIEAYFPDAQITANVLAGGQAGRYPAGNFFPPIDRFLAQFVNPAAGDYRLVRTSQFRGAATDGRDLGVDYDELRRALNGAPAPELPLPRER